MPLPVTLLHYRDLFDYLLQIGFHRNLLNGHDLTRLFMNSFVYAAIGPIIGGRRIFIKSKPAKRYKVVKHKQLTALIYIPYILGFTCKIEIAKVLRKRLSLRELPQNGILKMSHLNFTECVSMI